MDELNAMREQIGILRHVIINLVDSFESCISDGNGQLVGDYELVVRARELAGMNKTSVSPIID